MRVVVDEDAIGYDEVEVDVEIHEPAKPLHEGDGVSAWRRETALARDAALPGGDGADDERTGPARPGGIEEMVGD